MKWNIDKSFDFCYGHRVWNQSLDSRFSLDSSLVCRHLHGHQGKLKIHLEAKQLEGGMVTDFKHLNWFKKFLDDNIDHKIIFDINDPLLNSELVELYSFNDISPDQFDSTKSLFEYLVESEIIIDKEYFYVVNMELMKKIWTVSVNDGVNPHWLTAVLDKYKGMVFVDFVPTSENLCAWFARIVKDKMSTLYDIEKGRVEVKSVEFWETPKSHCEFIID